jgi:hypothetical protein
MHVVNDIDLSLGELRELNSLIIKARYIEHSFLKELATKYNKRDPKLSRAEICFMNNYYYLVGFSKYTFNDEAFIGGQKLSLDQKEHWAIPYSANEELQKEEEEIFYGIADEFEFTDEETRQLLCLGIQAKSLDVLIEIVRLYNMRSNRATKVQKHFIAKYHEKYGLVVYKDSRNLKYFGIEGLTTAQEKYNWGIPIDAKRYEKQKTLYKAS